VFRVTAEGESEQKKKKKDEDKKVKKVRMTKISDVSDDEADGGGWEAVKGGIATMVVSQYYVCTDCNIIILATLTCFQCRLKGHIFLYFVLLCKCF